MRYGARPELRSHRTTTAVPGRQHGSLKPTLTRVPTVSGVIDDPASHHGAPASRSSSTTSPRSAPNDSSVAVPRSAQRSDDRRFTRKAVSRHSRPGHQVPSGPPTAVRASVLDDITSDMKWIDLGRGEPSGLGSSAFPATSLEKPTRAARGIKHSMSIAPVARFAVPAGTAAAIVVAREPTGDEFSDSRRFGAIAGLDDARFRGSFEELVVAGVYTVLADRVLVLRISRSGVRSLAALVRLDAAGSAPNPRAGLDVDVATYGAPADASQDEVLHEVPMLRALLESETKQRPVFHGMTADGITYSGFEAQATASILDAARPLIPPHAPSAALCLVFAGPAVEVPEGLIVGVRQASV